MSDVSVEELARWTGRGRRSGIGLHGFEHGGLIVDGGRRDEADIPPLLARLPFPEDWSILVVRPPGESGLHGPDENRAFANLPPITQDVTDALCRLVLLEILPAVIERDLPAFGAALAELQARVGACFAPAQGGIYSTALASRSSTSCEASGSSASARAPGARLSMPFRLFPSKNSRRRPSGCASDSASTKHPFS